MPSRVTKSNPSLFMNFAAPPPPPSSNNKFMFNNQQIPSMPGYFQMPPVYGKINLLNARYGYQPNPRPRSESHVLGQSLLNKAKPNVSFDEHPIPEKGDLCYQETFENNNERKKKKLERNRSLYSNIRLYSNHKNVSFAQQQGAKQQQQHQQRVLSYSSIFKLAHKSTSKSKSGVKLNRKHSNLYKEYFPYNRASFRTTAPIATAPMTTKYKSTMNLGFTGKIDENDETTVIDETYKYFDPTAATRYPNLNVLGPTYFQPNYFQANNYQYRFTTSQINLNQIPVNVTFQ